MADKSIAELRLESERAREQLSLSILRLRGQVGATVAEIKEKASPDHLKKEARDYARERRDTLYESVERNVRQNPLRAAAIGAAVAYPLVSLVRAIPLPALAIG